MYAACITGIASAQSSPGFALYHLGNRHWDDGISLDRIADWVASSGYRLTRLAPHGEWYAAFKAALEALDVKRKQQSPLPTVYQWERPISGSGELGRLGALCGLFLDPPMSSCCSDASVQPHPSMPRISVHHSWSLPPFEVFLLNEK